MIQFKVLGIPTGQKRPRVYRLKSKFGEAGRRTVTVSPKDDWFFIFKTAAEKNRPSIPLDGPLHMSIVFTMPKPASAKKSVIYPAVKPDLDNLAKAALDACNQAQIWRDDSRVVALTLTKIYGSPAGAFVSIWPMEESKQ